MNILLVDDKKLIHKQLTSLLEKEGHKVVSAMNGLQGFEMAQQMPYDFFIIDHLMPVMDGIQLVKNIFANEAIIHPRILFMTTQNSAELQLSGDFKKVIAVIEKPINEELLCGYLRKECSHNTVA